MPINQLPGVYYDERVTFELDGEGSKIPVFIGKTGNSPTGNYKTDGSVILEFTNATDVFRDVTGTGDDFAKNTGIGEPSTDNQLATVIKDFLEEARLIQSTDIGVAKFFVVDLGNCDKQEDLTRAIANVKALYEAPVEVYVGLESIKNGGTAVKVEDSIVSIAQSIHDATWTLNLRYAFFTKMGATDEEIKTLADACVGKYQGQNIQYLSRVGLCVPELFGKTMARICCTPYSIEPGYYVYRSVNPNVFERRTAEKALQLQSKGVIFNRDEYINGDKYPKLNLCVSLAFNSAERPADSLFHARFNADDLLREVFSACYTQIKANESSTNLAYLQSRINKIVNDRVSAEEMIKYNVKTEEGTILKVVQSTEDPYTLIVTGQIQPQKCTVAIKVEAEVRI